MKTKILMLALLLGIITVVIAQPKRGERGKSFQGPKHEMRMDDRRGGPGNGLNLTDAQMEAFKQNRLTMQKQLQPIQNQLGEAEAHQKTLMTAEKPDMAAINKNIEKIGSLRVEMAKITTKNRLDMRAQLTEEQRLRFDTFKGRMNRGGGPEGMRRNMRMKG